jgi:hypothetical protein
MTTTGNGGTIKSFLTARLFDSPRHRYRLSTLSASQKRVKKISPLSEGEKGWGLSQLAVRTYKLCFKGCMS